MGHRRREGAIMSSEKPHKGSSQRRRLGKDSLEGTELSWCLPNSHRESRNNSPRVDISVQQEQSLHQGFVQMEVLHQFLFLFFLN